MRVLILLLVIVGLVGCDVANVSDDTKKVKGNDNQIKNEFEPILKQGCWSASLSIDSLHDIPFVFEVLKDSIFFINAEERLGAVIIKEGNDLIVKMPIFDSEFRFFVKESGDLEGLWFNYAKGEEYKMPFFASYTDEDLIRFSKKQDNRLAKNKIEGKWETTFSPNTSSTYKAVGLFEEENDVVSGTFLTETGDYRFLEGVVENDSLFLSCFDGSHAFLFVAELKGDSLYGEFFSGNHYQDRWEAVKNENFELSNPDSLTRLNIGVNLSFELPSLVGEPVIYPSDKYKDKVVIIQVMGSWCPNCMDETQLFTNMYDFYHERGLEVIAVAFEKPVDLIGKKERVAGQLRNT